MDRSRRSSEVFVSIGGDDKLVALAAEALAAAVPGPRRRETFPRGRRAHRSKGSAVDGLLLAECMVYEGDAPGGEDEDWGRRWIERRSTYKGCENKPCSAAYVVR